MSTARNSSTGWIACGWRSRPPGRGALTRRYAAPIGDWADVPVAGAPSLTGKGYRYEFVVPEGASFASEDLWRLRQPYGDHIVCHVTTQAIRWSVNGGAFQFARG